MERTAVIAHHIPGRVRIAIANAKRDVAALEEIRGFLCSLPQVSAVQANVITGTVVILYDPHDDSFLQRLSELGEESGLLELSRDTPAFRRQGEVRGKRKVAGRLLMAAGVAGVLLPVIPGTPFLLAGAAVLGPGDPVVSRTTALIRRLVQTSRRWKRIAQLTH